MELSNSICRERGALIQVKNVAHCGQRAVGLHTVDHELLLFEVHETACGEEQCRRIRGREASGRLKLGPRFHGADHSRSTTDLRAGCLFRTVNETVHRSNETSRNETYQECTASELK